MELLHKLQLLQLIMGINRMANIKEKSKQLESATKLKLQAIERSEIYTDPVITSAITINSINNCRLDTTSVAKALAQNASKVVNGDISEIELMLITQAQTLNALFHYTLLRASDVQMINQIQVFSDIALRAQNQSRKTLAVLAELKNPRRAVFIKHQNNAINQQVNNTSTS